MLLADGPPNPDWKLLDLCAEAVHHLTAAEQAWGFRPLWAAKKAGYRMTEADRKDDGRLLQTHRDGITRARPPLKLIAKMQATTAAGIYAKATVVRASVTSAASVGRSLATELRLPGTAVCHLAAPAR